MPTYVLRPVAVGFYDQCTLAAGANKVVAVDPGYPLAHDDATTIMIVDGNGLTQSYLLEDVPGATISVQSFKLAARWRNPDTAGHTLRTNVRITGFSEVAGPTWFRAASQPSFTTETATAIAAPPGGGSWTRTSVNAVDCGFYLQVGEVPATTQVYVTSFWAEVDLTLAAGGWACVVASLAALLGSCLQWSDTPRLAAELARRERVTVAPTEMATLYREVRENPRRRFFQMARERREDV